MKVKSQLRYDPNSIDQRFTLAEALVGSASSVAVPAVAASAAVNPAAVSPDWRQHVLEELRTFTDALGNDYSKARQQLKTQAWEAKVAPIATGSSAAGGSVLAGLGGSLVSGPWRFGFVVGGAVLALVGTVFSANTYVRNRSMMLRFLRLMNDMADYAYLVLPSASPQETYQQLDTYRQQWESAGS